MTLAARDKKKSVPKYSQRTFQRSVIQAIDTHAEVISDLVATVKAQAQFIADLSQRVDAVKMATLPEPATHTSHD